MNLHTGASLTLRLQTEEFVQGEKLGEFGTWIFEISESSP